jgi:tRNA pseudouridine32 synthase/23S rRNA pseudouridine746 synthase
MINPSSSDHRLDIVNDTLRTRYWSWTYLTSEGSPKRLIEVLHRELSSIPKDSWPERFDFGGIYINGHPALLDQALPFPCRVEYYEPKFSISEAPRIYPTVTESAIIYSDGDIAIAYKPASLSSMPAKEQRHYSLKSSLEKLLGVTIHMPSRLDVSAQGLVLVSTAPRAHAPLQQAFESRRVTKRYLCAAAGVCPWDTRVERGLIGRDPLHPVLRVSPAHQGQTAETIFTKLGVESSSGQEVVVLCAQPVTGRTHQIRVHAAANALPLLGDKFYGGHDASYLHLVSSYISFLHPIDGRVVECEVPVEFERDWMRSSVKRISSLSSPEQ